MLNPRLLTAPTLTEDEIDIDIDIDGAERVTYLLEQSFQYEYATPARQLRHRLVVLPPPRHGGQHLRSHRVDIDGAPVRRVTRRDRHGNTVLRLSADRVDTTVRFRVGALLERVRRDDPLRLPATALSDPRLLRPTILTAADDSLRALAAVARNAGDGSELGADICRSVYDAMTYAHGVTSIQTTAAAALAGGRGVCQDSAHIMLAVCHLLAVPARYVSGHLLGQGGTHAWVEVITAHGDHAIATAYDPCNGRPASARYITVATGRDYNDVAPTSGTYHGSADARLTTSRRLVVLAAA